MSISSSPVQQATASGTAATNQFTVTIAAPAAGSLLVLALSVAASTLITVSSVSGGGVTWAGPSPRSNTNKDVEIWYGMNSSGIGTTITITMSGSMDTGGKQVNACVSEWSGIATSSALDTSGGNSGTSANPATATITPTAGRDVLLIACARRGSTLSSGPTNSFTQFTQGVQVVTGGAAWRVVAGASGTYVTDWTYGGSGSWDAAIAAFLAPAAAGGVLLRVANLSGLGGGGQFSDPLG